MSDHHDCALGHAVVTATTDKALCVVLVGATNVDEKGIWVPRSVIHDDSEIEEDASEGDEGELVVKLWWAEKEGRA